MCEVESTRNRRSNPALFVMLIAVTSSIRLVVRGQREAASRMASARALNEKMLYDDRPAGELEFRRISAARLDR